MPKVSNGAKYCKRYTEKDMEKALQAIKKGMGKKAAARKFNIPRATLQFRLSNAFVKNRPGPDTVLSTEEENELVDWIITLSRKGFPRRKEDIMKSVKLFLDEIPRPNSFINNTPGEGWYKLFLKRHPVLSKSSEAVPSANAKVTEAQIRNWFQKIEDYLKENDLFHILRYPSRVYNGEETNFILCPKNSEIVSLQETKNVYDHVQSKSCVTFMFTFGADGEQTPPMIIFPSKTTQSEVQKSAPDGWGIGFSDKGWMNTDLLSQYIEKILHPALKKKDITFPVILFLDGHKSHITYQVTELCQSLEIILIALYPNATRILQPADVAAFRPIKVMWRKAVLEWTNEVTTEPIHMTDVAPILVNFLPKINKNSLKNGFAACGLYPFNPDHVNYTKCLMPSTLESEKFYNNYSAIVDFQTFQDLVGPRLMKKMKNQVVGKSLEAKKLFELYKYLSPKSSTQKKNNKRKRIKNDSEGDFYAEEELEFLDINESTTNLSEVQLLSHDIEMLTPIEYDEYSTDPSSIADSSLEDDILDQHCENSLLTKLIVPDATHIDSKHSKETMSSKTKLMNTTGTLSTSRQHVALVNGKWVKV